MLLLLVCDHMAKCIARTARIATDYCYHYYYSVVLAWQQVQQNSETSVSATRTDREVEMLSRSLLN